MFARIGYYISQEHFKDICEKAFEFKELITFEEFMETFKVKESPHALRDIKNAFRLIAGDEDQFIPVDLIYELFRKNGVERERIDDLMAVLSPYVDQQSKRFDYR